ncbi:hypothetical protein E2C01_093099 [Portunus trituberculatus]|uniref:Uncharacterized protein n=1 Tax=Portunus trituberculatus TaxID=210409 RepID=A0A5B7JX86_PORTR|nr:hypothetical protein [Portunus trituberculatus]
MSSDPVEEFMRSALVTWVSTGAPRGVAGQGRGRRPQGLTQGW